MPFDEDAKCPENTDEGEAGLTQLGIGTCRRGFKGATPRRRREKKRSGGARDDKRTASGEKGGRKDNPLTRHPREVGMATSPPSMGARWEDAAALCSNSTR